MSSSRAKGLIAAPVFRARHKTLLCQNFAKQLNICGRGNKNADARGYTIVPVYKLKAYRGRRGKAPLIRNLGARLRWVLITARQLCQRTPVPTEQKGGWLQGHEVLKDINRLTLTEIRTPNRRSLSTDTDWGMLAPDKSAYTKYKNLK